MNRDINKILAIPAVQARFIELGAQAVPVSPADYKSMVRTETKLSTEIVKARGITAD